MTAVEIRVDTRSDDFQLIQSLQTNRKKRSQRRQFIVEGVRSIDALLDSRWQVDAYVFSQTRTPSEWARQILSTSKAARHFALADELMAEISDRDEPSELIAVVAIPEPIALDALPVREPALVVVADRTASPGNLGTLIRSCDALGADALAVLGHAADLYDPRTIRAATGSWFAVSVAPVASPRALARWIDALRGTQPALQVVGSSASGTVPISQCDFTAPTVLGVGSERAGLSHSLAELCDRVVVIPIQGAASSLNLASAASILLYEVARQRNRSAARA